MVSPINKNYLSIVKAIYPFKGANNDELCFKKDDLIILTQTPEGGWFEGTHLCNRMTGWFPAAYVTPLDQEAIHSLLDNQFILNFQKDSSLQTNRCMVITDLIESEENHLKELSNTLHKYILPLQKSLIFQSEEVDMITKYFCEVFSIHQKLYNSLKLEKSKASSGKDQMIGGIFMGHAREMKEAHINYCSIHPKFIHNIETHKEEVYNLLKKENQIVGPLAKESTLLTTGLSLSFRYLDKYLACLQELQRYTDDAHPDRGDIQRAGFVYRELVSTCLQVRRQAEMEVEVMLGNVKNWPPGEPIQSLGTVDHMGPVTILSKDGSPQEIKKDRYLVLFPAHLIILTVSNEMSSFVFEEKVALVDITLPRLPEIQSTKTTFELLYTDSQSQKTGKFHLMCNNPEDVRKWISLMHKCKSKLEPKALPKDLKLTHPSLSSDGSSPSLICADNNRSKYWATKSLLPHPPIRRSLSNMDDTHKVDSVESNKDDMLILGVIEAYCTNDRKVTGLPQMLVKEESQINKPMPSPNKRSELSRSLQEEVGILRKQVNTLAKALVSEKKERTKIKKIVDELLIIVK